MNNQSIFNRLKSYEKLPGGVSDELLDSHGNLRPVWKPFVDFIQRLTDTQIEDRFSRGNQYLRDAGVFFRQYGEDGSSERDWPLSHIPVLIDEKEWTEISEGLIQRADLLEKVIADLYGPNRLVSEGFLPPELIARSPEWLKPMINVRPKSGHYLSFIAFEIGRGPDGRWWVLGDRTQAPSGAGFALENRVATSRVFSDFYGEANVHRLSGFFRSFRQSLNDLCDDQISNAAILTPGRHNDTYFEHAYIARYLGFMLLEGEDLTVIDGHVMVRTVTGPKPISVLWRRLDAAFTDPLELNENSRLGTAGLMSAVRAESVSMVNALGSGILEMRALLAFLPRICEVMMGETLKLPNIATWWCGQEKERVHVFNNAEEMIIGEALSTSMPFDLNDRSIVRGHYNNVTHNSLLEYLDEEGNLLVGQEAVSLSTTPAYVKGELKPRPMSLRVFLARTPFGWQVMPGGYARIGISNDATAVAMQSGGSVADVWVVSENKVDTDSMISKPRTGAFIRTMPETLPSRAADNLFWLGRYVERADNLMRLLRSYNVRLAESEDPETDLLMYLEDYIEGFGVDMTQGIPSVLCDTISYTMNSAAQVRDRFSVDGWMALRDLSETAQFMSKSVHPGDQATRALSLLMRKVTGFSGLVHENMYHYTGWRFMSIGRSLERASSTSSFLSSFLNRKAPDGSLDLALDVGESQMSHRRRYSVTTNRDTVVDMMVLDKLNPRSVYYHLSELREHLRFIPGGDDQSPMSDLTRAILLVHTTLAVRTPETLDVCYLEALYSSINDLSNLITTTYLR